MSKKKIKNNRKARNKPKTWIHEEEYKFWGNYCTTIGHILNWNPEKPEKTKNR